MYATQNITRLKSLDRIVRIFCCYSAFSIRAAQIRPSLELQTIFFYHHFRQLRQQKQACLAYGIFTSCSFFLQIFTFSMYMKWKWKKTLTTVRFNSTNNTTVNSNDNIYVCVHKYIAKFERIKDNKTSK